MHLTYRYRLLTSRANRRRLEAAVEAQRHLYNAALLERIDCYAKTGRTITYLDQSKSLTACRAALPEMAAMPAHLQRGTLRRLDRAFQSFFRRVKAGQKPGFPRFKGRGWYDTLEWAEFQGITFDGRRIRSKAFGSIRVHMHRPLEGAIRTARLTRDGNGWYVCFVCEVEAPPKTVVTAERCVGLDVGLSALATLSTGEKLPTLHAARKAQAEMRRRERHLARCCRGSGGRRKARERVARLHRKVRNIRRTYAHQQSAALVRRYNLIAVEDLNVVGMAKGVLARSVADAGWSTLIEMLTYKAERAGGHLIRVDARNTTQACSDCGGLVRKDLSTRVHACPDCGLRLDRDHNAARNVLHKAFGDDGVPGRRNVGQWPVRADGNLAS